jgi:hypothetical protein
MIRFFHVPTAYMPGARVLIPQAIYTREKRLLAVSKVGSGWLFYHRYEISLISTY